MNVKTAFVQQIFYTGKDVGEYISVVYMASGDLFFSSVYYDTDARRAVKEFGRDFPCYPAFMILPRLDMTKKNAGEYIRNIEQLNNKPTSELSF